MSKLILNQTNAAGITYSTKPARSTLTQLIVQPELKEISGNLQKARPDEFPSHTSKNSVSAYLMYLEDIINGFSYVDGAGARGEKSAKDIVDASIKDPGNHNLAALRRDIEKYLVLYANILLSQLLPSTHAFTMSFLPLNSEFPYKAAYDAINKSDRTETLLSVLRQIREELGRLPHTTYNPAACTAENFLAFICFNGEPVAYYSSYTEGIGIYPFMNTVTRDDPSALLGVSSVLGANNYCEWRFDLDEFIEDYKGMCAGVNAPLDNEKQLQFCKKLNNLSPNLAAIRILIDRMSANGCWQGGPELAAVQMNEVPLKLTGYRDLRAGLPTAQALSQHTLPDNDAAHSSFLMVPVSRDVLGDCGNDYYKALAHEMPSVNLLEAQANPKTLWLFVSSADPNFSFSYGGPIDTYGMEIQDLGNAETITLGVSYRGKNLGNIVVPLDTVHDPISLAMQLKVHKMIFDKNTGKVLYYNDIDNVVEKVSPMTNYVWLKEDDWGHTDNCSLVLAPLSKEFCTLLHKFGMTCDDPVISSSGDNYEVKATIRHGTESFVVTKTYDHAHQVNQLDFPMPELWVYPYCRFQFQDNGGIYHDILKKIYLTALDQPSTRAFEEYDELQIYACRESGVFELLDQATQQKALGGSQKLDLPYAARLTSLPSDIQELYFSHERKYGELGCFFLDIPKHTVSLAKTASVGLDMGSRNSVVICDDGGAAAIHTYHPVFNGQSLYKCIVKMDTTDDPQGTEQMELLRAIFTEGESLPHGNQSFVSTVYTFDNFTAANNTPFKTCRVVTAISPEQMNHIMAQFQDHARSNKQEPVQKLSEIGIYRDFKRKSLQEAATTHSVSGATESFLLDAMYHMILNALVRGCGDIEIYFSVPTKKYAEAMNQTIIGLIKSEKGFLRQNFNLKQIGYYDAGVLQNLSIEGTGIQLKQMYPKLEAIALFGNLPLPGAGSAPELYSVVIDGGDSTFDVSLIDYTQTVNMGGAASSRVQRNFSIAYAGAKILVDTIIDVCSKLKVNFGVFLALWACNNPVDLSNKDSLVVSAAMTVFDVPKDSPMEDLLERTVEWGVNDNDKNAEGTPLRDAVYRLIEGPGLNNPSHRDNITIVSNAICHDHAQANNIADRAVYVLRVINTVIRYKYVSILTIILSDLAEDIFPEGAVAKDTAKIAAVYLYGGTNRLAHSIWSSDDAMKGWIQKWWNNNTGRSDIHWEVKYKVKSQKTDLVTGLLQDRSAQVVQRSIDPPEDVRYTTRKYIEYVDRLDDDSDRLFSQLLENIASNRESPLAQADELVDNTIVYPVDLRNRLEDNFGISFNIQPQTYELLYTFFLSLDMVRNGKAFKDLDPKANVKRAPRPAPTAPVQPAPSGPAPTASVQPAPSATAPTAPAQPAPSASAPAAPAPTMMDTQAMTEMMTTMMTKMMPEMMKQMMQQMGMQMGQTDQNGNPPADSNNTPNGGAV